MSCWCAVPKCTNNSKKKVSKLSFFRFPKDPERWRKWIECIDRCDLLKKTSLYAYKNCFVCSEHFEEKFFLNDLRNRLQPTAIPTVFKHLQNTGSSESFDDTSSTATVSSKIVTVSDFPSQLTLQVSPTSPSFEKEVEMLHTETDNLGLTRAKKVQLNQEDSSADHSPCGSIDPPQVVFVKSEVPWDADDASARSSPAGMGREATDPLQDVDSLRDSNANCDGDRLFLSKHFKYHKALLGKVRNQLCRICGTKQKSLSPLSTDDNRETPSLVMKIEMHLPLQISDNERLPPNICVTCRELVESWHKLHVSCLAADSMLRKMFSSEDNEVVLENRVVEISSRKKKCQDFQCLQDNCNHLGKSLECDKTEVHTVSEQLPMECNMEKEQAVDPRRNFEKESKETRMEVDHTYIKSSSGSTSTTGVENSSHICKYCGETFGSKKEFAQHKKPCSEEPTVCDMCGERVPQRCQLNKHIRKHLLVCTSFVCEACDQKFTSADGLQCHLNTRHNGEETMKYFCEPCCKLFLNEQTYKRHEQHHEKGLLKSLNFKIDPAYESGSERIFICPVCEATFNDKMSLIVHMNTAKKKKCSKCKEWIRTEKQSLLHKCKQRICQYCGKRFNTRVGLYAHELIHKREKRFACQTCGAKFVTSSAVIQHRVIHDPPSFQCGECGKQFKLRYSYEDHMREHLGIKHTCPYCDKKFTARKSLYRHKRKCHLVR